MCPAARPLQPSFPVVCTCHPDRVLVRPCSLSRSVMPFGGGESLCPGRHFAKNEIAQFVAGVLLQFDVALDPVCARMCPRPPYVICWRLRPPLAPNHFSRACCCRPRDALVDALVEDMLTWPCCTTSRRTCPSVRPDEGRPRHLSAARRFRQDAFSARILARDRGVRHLDSRGLLVSLRLKGVTYTVWHKKLSRQRLGSRRLPKARRDASIACALYLAEERWLSGIGDR